MTISVVVIGARGYTGGELLPLLYRHPECRIVALGSGSAAGQAVKNHLAGLEDTDLVFSDIQPDKLEHFPADVYILALPNGHASGWVAAVESECPDSVVIDLSADFRFDPTWVYGQPERFEAQIMGANRIANPGCYATGAQLAIAPLLGQLASTPVVFGVSGYSGAGNTPSRKNDQDVLKDNLLPYSLAGHVHEKEVSHHLAREIRLLPHVASFFRGISLTVAVELEDAISPEALHSLYRDAYAPFPLLSIQADIPEVAAVRNKHEVIIGGFTVSEADPRQVTLVCVLDNLLKGAATQAVQNLNLAFKLPPCLGILPREGLPT
jgi:N-acetyl-gamma-glutamyl-phosphate reductase